MAMAKAATRAVWRAELTINRHCGYPQFKTVIELWISVSRIVDIRNPENEYPPFLRG
jgi:hypothetical protein